MSDSLVLSSQSLCSKWGFGDGDAPDWIYDRWEEAGHDYQDLDWHPILIALVRKHLLPALAEHHTITVYEVGTIHNPIRASRIDGVEIDDYAADDSGYPVLTPEFVAVPWEDVQGLIESRLTVE